MSTAFDEEVRDTIHEIMKSAGPQDGAVLGRAVLELAREFRAARDTPDFSDLRANAGALTDPMLLARVMSLLALQHAARPSTEARLALEGARRLAELLARHGGTYSAREVGERLGGISADTVRRRGARLLSVRLGRQRYPVWQFHGSGLLAGFAEVLAKLHVGSDVAKTRFFLTPATELGGLTPLEALRRGDQQPMVERLAEQFGQQGAR